MAKRGKHGSDRGFDQKDNPIGLTGAFDPIQAEIPRRYDDPVGLTQAFGPIEDPEATENWDSSDKWQGFDWSAPVPGAEDDEAVEDAGEDGPIQDDAGAAAPDDGKARAGRGGRHARHAAKKGEADGGAQASRKVSARMEQSRKTRKRLVGIIILLLIIVAALGFAGYYLLTGKMPFVEQPAGETQVEGTSEDVEAIVAPNAEDSQEVAVKVTDTPDLSGLFGKSQKAALAEIGHGGIVTSTMPIKDEESAVKETVTVELSDEPGNPRSGGTPKVYLGLDEDGNVLQVGYSSPVGLLGYGTLNFGDAVSKEHIIEKTLQAIGGNVEEGTVVLPKDAKEYTTYDKDGSTVVKERYSFDGDVDVNGVPCSWSAVLSYDYTSANISGNASETVRLIYVYLTRK